MYIYFCGVVMSFFLGIIYTMILKDKEFNEKYLGSLLGLMPLLSYLTVMILIYGIFNLKYSKK